MTSEWVGIDGFTNQPLIKTGVYEAYSPVSRNAIVVPWWEISPASAHAITSMSVRTGDNMSAQARQVRGQTWQISLIDNTTRQRFDLTTGYAGPGTSAEWVVEAPTINRAVLRLGVYSPPVAFSGLATTGAGARVDEVVMVQRGSVVSTPSPLDPNGFAVAYGPAAPPAP